MSTAKCFLSKWLTILLLAMLMAGGALAQGGKGAIRGRVMDASGAALVGAQVILEQSGASAVSDAQGQFFINDIQPGTYTVGISYVGFTPMEERGDGGRGSERERGSQARRGVREPGSVGESRA